MSQTILHVDLNAFYASVECLYRPEIRDKPVAVYGDAEARHGIVLTKNQIAKQAGVKTGESIWEAKLKCPGLVTISADFSKYLRFSRKARMIYLDYTDQIESFCIDEAWLDVTGSIKLFGPGSDIANTIRTRFREELGLTASAGVSWNKIFAKLGSDMKKPDATTVITEENFRDKPIRSIGVRGADLVTANGHIQIDLFDGDNLEAETLEQTIDTIRKRFGHYSVQRCAMLLDRQLTGFNPKDDHTIHPISYFK